jgi:hypothetical protein
MSEFEQLPPLPIVDNRTPEQLAADGDHRWPDGSLYVPPGQKGPLYAILRRQDRVAACATTLDGKVVIVEYYWHTLRAYDFYLWYEQKGQNEEYTPDDIHQSFIWDEDEMALSLQARYALDVNAPVWEQCSCTTA